MQHISVLISSKVWEVEAKTGEFIFNPTLEEETDEVTRGKDKDDGKDDYAGVEQQFAAREGRKCIRAHNVLFYDHNVLMCSPLCIQLEFAIPCTDLQNFVLFLL